MNRAVIPIQVDRDSPVPLYYQVAHYLELMIDSGDLPDGTWLENETDLADRLGLSRPTMRQAMEYLVSRGLLVRKRGIGTQVVHTKVTRDVELTSLYEDLAQARRHPSTRVVSFKEEPASEDLAAKLGIPAGTQVYAFDRLRYADSEPLALMRNHVPVSLIHLTEADLEVQGLYNLFRANGINLRIARQAIGARAATAAEARVLGESRGAVVLTMERAAYDDQGRAVEHGNHIYLASRYSFDLTLNSQLAAGGVRSRLRVTSQAAREEVEELRRRIAQRTERLAGAGSSYRDW